MNEVHGRSVHQHVREAYVRELARPDPLPDVAPQARGLEHVRLVDRGEPAASSAGERGRDAHDALDLRRAVAAHVTRVHGVALFLAEIDSAGELAHEYQVDASDDLGF